MALGFLPSGVLCLVFYWLGETSASAGSRDRLPACSVDLPYWDVFHVLRLHQAAIDGHWQVYALRAVAVALFAIPVGCTATDSAGMHAQTFIALHIGVCGILVEMELNFVFVVVTPKATQSAAHCAIARTQIDRWAGEGEGYVAAMAAGFEGHGLLS